MHEEGEDQVKSICPLRTGLDIYTMVFNNEIQKVMFW